MFMYERRWSKAKKARRKQSEDGWRQDDEEDATEKQQQEGHAGRWMTEGLCGTVQPPPHNLKEPATMDRKLPEKKNEVTSRKAATFIPKAQERGESEDWRHNKNVRHKKRRDTEPATAGGLWHPI